MKEVKGQSWKDSINVEMVGNIVVPIIAVIFAMIIGAIFMVSVGANPVEAYS